MISLVMSRSYKLLYFEEPTNGIDALIRCDIRSDLIQYVTEFFFFFQAEDGIRDYKVTGVQTCALPICVAPLRPGGPVNTKHARASVDDRMPPHPPMVLCKWQPLHADCAGAPIHFLRVLQIGRASCRERV